MVKSLSLLGATGSIGTSTARLLAAHPDAFEVHALVAQKNAHSLAKMAKMLKAKVAVLADSTQYQALKEYLHGTGIEAAAGEVAVLEAASRKVDICVSAIVGAAGLAPTVAAVRAAKIVALANKEALVCAGTLLLALAKKHHCTLLPVDSEHNAIFQVFDAAQRGAIDHITLTASGGPFREHTAEELKKVTPAEATRHPIWEMGQKISVDSATLMNKGLEVIEACYLFGLAEDKVEVLVHPQSVVHGMVNYTDGSVLAQMGSPDMVTPLAYALAWPQRIAAPVLPLNLTQIAILSFEAVDHTRFPCLHLARQAFRQGGSAPIVLNAANEVAVTKFLRKEISFPEIPSLIKSTLTHYPSTPVTCLADVFAIDAGARRLAHTQGTVSHCEA